MDTQNTQTPDEFRGKGALDAFMNLLSLVTVGWTAISFGGVIFQIINKYFGAGRYAYSYEGYYSGPLKFHIASLIIVTPAFLILMGLLHKNYKEKKLNSQSGIHRWLTYLMLFIAFCNILGGLIALIYKFLDGEFFSAFILKSLTVLIIALGVFGYYWYDLKRQNYDSKSQISLISSIVVGILVLASVIGGFLLIGSPRQSRLYNFDQQRINDLSNLRWQIQDYYTTNKKLPDSLASAPQLQQVKDPETNAAYEYRVVSQKGFELCALFSLDASIDMNNRDYYKGSEAWYYHKAGRQCYKLEVQDQQDVIKPIPGPIPLSNH